MQPKKGKILVIRGGAIGDFVLTLPALAALRAQFPDTHLAVLGYPHIAQLAQLGGFVDEVRSIESRPLASFFAPQGDLSRSMAAYFAGFDIVVSYLYDPDEVFQDNFARCSNAQFIQGPHRPDEKGRLHATETFLKPLERLAIFGADAIPRLRPVSNGDSGLPPGRWVALHPGSGSESKNWPERKWAELIQQLIATTDWNLLLIGGVAEGDRPQRLAAGLPDARFQLAHRLPLTDLARRVKHCAAFVGHDSGITHLAAALDLPGLVLWSHTVEHVWRPQSERMIIVREPKGLVALPVSRVLTQLKGLMKLVAAESRASQKAI